MEGADGTREPTCGGKWPWRLALSLEDPVPGRSTTRLIDILADGEWGDPERELVKRQDGRWMVVTPRGIIVSRRDRRFFEAF